MLVYSGTFELHSEVASDIAGFAGALGGRDRAYGLGALFAAVAAITLPGVIRMARTADKAMTTPGAVYFVIASYAVIIPLCIANGFLIIREWPLIVAFSISALMGLWLFNRLLTRPGWSAAEQGTEANLPTSQSELSRQTG